MPAESVAGAKRRLRTCERHSPRKEPPGTATSAHQRLLALPELARVGTVSLYLGQGREVPTAELFRELARRGLRLALPRVQGSELSLREVRDLSELSGEHRGIRQPGADSPAISPEEVDLFVVPGVCFDRSGARLGRGGGHFDRLLARAGPRALRVGLCYASQIVEQVPTEAWDERVDILVAESGVIRVERGAP